MPTPPFLTASPFEAEYLGGPVWRLSDPAEAEAAAAYGRETEAVLIACRTSEGADLSGSGFRKIETLATFEATFSTLAPTALPTGIALRHAAEDDIPVCRAIAVAELRQNRFHADPAVSDAAADTIRAAWIENAIRGRADRVLVACGGDDVLGFNALLRREGIVVIDLVAVSAGAQGRGIGRALVTAVASEYGPEVTTIRAGTQVANAASIAFYEKLGLHEIACHDTWHWTPE